MSVRKKRIKICGKCGHQNTDRAQCSNCGWNYKESWFEKWKAKVKSFFERAGMKRIG